MKLVKRLSHTAKEMNDSIFGWDIFRCRDYAALDRSIDEPIDFSEISKLDPVFGYTIIFAVNLKVIKLFKRLFIKTT